MVIAQERWALAAVGFVGLDASKFAMYFFRPCDRQFFLWLLQSTKNELQCRYGFGRHCLS